MIEFINTNLAYFVLIAVLLASIHHIIHRKDEERFFEKNFNISPKRFRITWVLYLVICLVFFFYFFFNII